MISKNLKTFFNTRKKPFFRSYFFNSYSFDNNQTFIVSDRVTSFRFVRVASGRRLYPSSSYKLDAASYHVYRSLGLS